MFTCRLHATPCRALRIQLVLFHYFHEGPLLCLILTKKCKDQQQTPMGSSPTSGSLLVDLICEPTNS